MSIESFTRLCNAIESTASINEKQAYLKDASPTALALLNWTYNPLRTFGIKTLPEAVDAGVQDGGTDLFLDLLERLRKRELTGNLARIQLGNALGRYSSDDRRWLERVIQKDLRIGLSAKTINKAHRGLVYEFALMLARKLERTTPITFPMQVEWKYDGNRAICFFDGETATYTSRNGLPFDHLDGLFDEDLKVLFNRNGGPFVLDCEIMSHDFSGTQKAKGKKNDKSSLWLSALDFMDAENWEAKYCNVTQTERTLALQDLIEQPGGLSKIRMTRWTTVHNWDELEAEFALAVAAGLEGIVAKDPNGLYEWKRSSNWWKMKPAHTVDGRVKELIEGVKGSRREGSLGAVVFDGADENGNPFECNTGSGITDEFAALVWANREKYLGAIWEFAFDEMTLAEGATVYRLRFPRFRKERPDLTPQSA